MKQSELVAATESARETVTRMMKAAGYGNYVADIEKNVDYVEVVQRALEEAEKARLKVELEDPDLTVTVSSGAYQELRQQLADADKLVLVNKAEQSYTPDFMMGGFRIHRHEQP